MMANADKVAAEANAAAIAEDVGIVQGASADALGIGAGAAETLDGDTNDLCGMGARTSRSGKIKVHVASKSTVALYVVLGVLAAITVFALVVMDYGKVSFPAAMAAAVEDFVTMMTQPGLGGHFTLPDVIEGLFVSLALALLTTFIGAVIAFVLGLLAACNLSSKGMSNAIKVFMSVARAVPTILWVLVFSVAIGLGPEAAVTGLLFHSVAYLVKAYSESFEEVDAGVLEALRASGASWWQVVFQGVVPEKVNEMLSWTFIRFEINFVNAVAVGAVAGAGGIGVLLLLEQLVRERHLLVRCVVTAARLALGQREQAALGRLRVVGELRALDEAHRAGGAHGHAATALRAIVQVERPHQQAFVLVDEDADSARIACHRAGCASDAALEVVARLSFDRLVDAARRRSGPSRRDGVRHARLDRPHQASPSPSNNASTRTARSAPKAPRMAMSVISMASMRRVRPKASSMPSSTSASAFVGQASTQRGPFGDFAHRSHITTDV